MASMIEGLLGRLRDPRVSQGLLASGAATLAAGGQGINPAQALGQGVMAYQQAYRGADEYQREQKLREIREKALEQITDADLQFLAQIDPSGQFVGQMLVARQKAQLGVDTPALVQEFQFARQQGFNGSFEDYIRLKRESYQSPTIVMTPNGLQAVQTSSGQGGAKVTSIPGMLPQYDPALQGAVTGAETAAKGAAERETEKASKQPAAASFRVAAQAMRDSIDTTPTGGPMGATGQLSRVTDYQKVRQFENRVQQLSTELRTIFRIPGEGTLSDREMQQYGIQLPDIRNDKSVNDQILKDIDARIAARTGSASATAAPAAPAGWAIRPKGN